MENDQIINILENTSPVIADLDCGKGENPDAGTDICMVRDKDTNGFGEDTEKPSSYILSLGELSSQLVTSDTTGKVVDKVEVGAVGGGDDGDGVYYVVVSDQSDPTKALTDNFFAGDVAQGDSFAAAGNFGSETFVHIFAAQGGAALQTINYHTSCSSPLIIGDQYGSVTLEGATLEGKDSGTIYTVGLSEVDGDAGVVYEITGGADADDFTVDADTGEVTFLTPPDFENPTDSDGDNKYDVEVTAFFVDDEGVRTGEICEVRPLEICVEDDCINILENTSPVIADLDCGKGENPDAGTDICMVRDKDTNGFGEDTEKPSSYILSLGELSSQLVTSDTTGKVVDKVEVGAVGGGDDGDGVYYVVVSDQSDPTKALTDNFFAGDVAQGDSFAAAGNFGSETFVHIFAAQGGAALQTINYHTSCSSPLIIGDQYGSVTLEGATLEGKDSGTIYTVGLSEVDGDAGVVYEITGGADADDFTVDADTGEVTFLTPPDFENPTDSDGDNKYDVEVTAFFVDDEGVRTGEICEVRPLEICVEDELDEICIDENTTPVVNVDLAVACPIETPRDVGLDICAARDRDVNGFGEDTDKPTAYILNLGEGLSDVIASSQDDDKVEVISTGATDDDGTFFIRVSKDDDPTKTDELFFEGDVGFGENFTASEDAFGNSFGSKTFVHIFSEDGGELLQSVEFHTSCSQPLVIGDQYGSISLAGATLVGKDTDTVYTVGGTETATEILGEGDIVYSIAGGADAAFFTIDPDTGELGFINAPDFENPQDSGGDNVYDVIVRATAINDPTCFTDKPLEVCVEDVPEVGSLSGRYFCDENRNDIEDAGDTPFADKLVTLLQGGVVVATTKTDANGDYRFDNLTPGDYVVLFEDPTTEGKAFVDPDVGTDDTVDSDVTDPSAGTTDPVTVVAGEETDNVDAGAEKLPGSISGRYFCDENDNDVDDGQAVDPGIAGVVVTAFDAAGTAVGSAVTGADGTYTIDGLEEGTYSVQFTDPDGVLEGKALVDPNVGDDDTVDSDAVGDTTLSTIADIPVTAGQDTPDNDAGAEKLPGSISGRYFCDENDNDVDDGQAVDPGIAGVVVTAFDAAGTAVGSAVTGADGTYTIDGLEEGTYSVQFTDPDGVLEGKALVDPNVGDDDTVDSDAVGDTTLSTIADIPVTAGQDTPDNDAGAEKLPGSISGRYFCDENDNDVDDGQAVDPGIAGVVVTAFDAAGTAVGSAVTGADGTYTIDGLEEGTYSVQFTDPDGVLEGKALVDPNVGDDDTVDSDAVGDTTLSTIADIPVTAGQDTPDNDAGAEKLPGSISGRYFCDENDNDVDDGQAVDPGIAGVVVTAFDAAGTAVGSAVTGADGTYTIDGLEEGTYSVQFTDPDGVLEGKALVDPNVGDDDTVDSDAVGDTTLSTIADIPVTAGQDTPDNDAGAEKLPGSISGRYFCDENDNDVDDGQAVDPGIAGVVVTAFDAAGTAVGSAVTGADGTYTIDGLEEGTYSVQFTDPDGVLEGKALVDPNVGDDDTVDSDAVGDTTLSTIADIPVTAGQDTPDNDAGAEKLPGSISGRYFCDENDNDVDDGQAVDPGIAGVVVTAFDAAGTAVGSAVTGADGTYTIDGLEEGTYSVQFTDPDGVLEGKALVDPNVGDDDTVDSDAVGDTTLSTIADIPVTAGQDTPDNDAGAEKLPGSISGRYFCDENDNDVDDGQAVDPGIAGVVVTAFDAAGTAVGSAVTGADGTYTIDGLEEGTYSVQFTDPDGVLEGKALVDPNVGDDDTVDSDAVGDTTLSTIADIPVTAGQDTPDNDAGAEKLPGSISGRYFCDENDNDVDDGQAVDPGIAGVVVTAFDAAGTAVGSAVTGADGTYTIDGLEEGTYSVQFTDPDGVLEGKALVDPNVGDDDTVDSDAVGDTTLSTIADIPVTAGQDTPDNDAGAEKLPGSISGRYFCDENRNDVDDGEPGVAGVTVVLTDGDGNFIAETMTESDGSYFFGNLQAGEYKVTFPEYEEDPEPPVEVDPENVQSDDFSSGELQPYWNTGNLNGATASVEVVDGNAQLCIKVPPGDFDANPNDGSNDIARLTQQIADDDFQVDVAFSSEPTERFELQGIVVEQDAENWMRFDVRSTGDGELRLFVAYVDESQPTIVLDSDIDDISEAAAMRVTRSGDDWTFETSSDGVVWIEQVSFTHAGIAPSAVGPYAGVLSDSVPGSGLDTDGYTAKVDYFFNSQDRINFEDSSLGVLSGKDFVEKDAGDDDTIDSDVDPKNGMTDVIYLAPGENKEDVDAGVKGPPLGVIGDTVWYDSFGNGLLDDFEQRASGITVQLKDGDGNVIAETVTNFSGNYLFQNLEAGEYSVGFVLPSEDFIFTDANAGDDALDSDADPVTGMTQTIILGEGEQNLTLDAGLRFCGLIEGTSQSDPNSPVGGNDLLVGCDGNDTIRGLSGEDTLFGLDGDDLIFGSFDADELFGGAGDDLLDGGSGVTRGFGSSNTDVAVYKGSLADYGLSAVDGEIFADGVVLTQTGADTFVFDTSGAGLNEGTDTLVDIEILRFDDGDFIL